MYIILLSLLSFRSPRAINCSIAYTSICQCPVRSNQEQKSIEQNQDFFFFFAEEETVTIQTEVDDFDVIIILS